MITANGYNRAKDRRRVFRPTFVLCLLALAFALFSAGAGFSNRDRVLAQDQKDRILADLIEQSPDLPVHFNIKGEPIESSVTARVLSREVLEQAGLAR